MSDYPEEVRQSCFDLLVTSLISDIINNPETDMNEETRAQVLDEIFNVLEEHLDEEGIEHLNEAFDKFEHEYKIQETTDNIISSFEWNKNK